MKTVTIISLVLLILALILPVLILAPEEKTETSPSPETSPPPPSPEASPSPVSSPEASPATPDPTASPGAPAADSLVITLLHNGSPINISMEDYLIGVVAAEMPASFNIEALKAQAIAARSYAFYKIYTDAHDGYDVCDNVSCCSAFFNQDMLHDIWGKGYDFYLDKIRSAIESTGGLYLTWEDEPIMAVYHSSSYGRTEASQNVWAVPLPYLVSVSSPETAETVSNLFSTVTISEDEFKETVLENFPDAVLGSDPEYWISYVHYSEAGHVTSLKLGGVETTGTRFRFLFGLRSTAFTFKLEEGAFVFSVSGYGHGVGMSQYGAHIMAEDGATYEEILANYYPGTKISAFSGVLSP